MPIRPYRTSTEDPVTEISQNLLEAPVVHSNRRGALDAVTADTTETVAGGACETDGVPAGKMSLRSRTYDGKRGTPPSESSW